MTGKDPLLTVRDLVVDFLQPREAPIRAVSGISWSISRGEVLAIVGESGSGKSVCTLALMGLLPRNARIGGSLLWQGRELIGLPQKDHRRLRGNRIALVPQDPMTSLNPVYTVGAQIREGLRAHQKMTETELDEKVLSLLEDMGIPNPSERAHAYPHELSGGMRQRVVIAMAMANSPDLIIADEATTALDVTVQAQVLDSLQRAQALTGAALLLITHDLGVVAGRADRVAVMNQGQLEEIGSVERIFYEPCSDYTRKLLNSIPRLDLPQTLTLGEMPPEGTELTPFVETPGWGKPGYKPPLLAMRGVEKHFDVHSQGVVRRRMGIVKAVGGVDLDLMAGETIGIVGESGSGKTTLIRSIFGLEPLTGGKILYDSQDIAKMAPRERRKMRASVQMVFQDPYASLDPMMTVRDILMEPALLNGMDRAEAVSRASDLLRRVHLRNEHAARYPNEFSGGQRQRIAIARALMTRPRLIVLDEPVSALDVSIQAQVLELLQELQRDLGLSYLFVSHDLSVVAEIAHKVIVMYRGRIVERGSTDEIFSTPKHPYTRALLSAVPVPDPRIERQRQRIVFTDTQTQSVLSPPPLKEPRARWLGGPRK